MALFIFISYFPTHHLVAQRKRRIKEDNSKAELPHQVIIGALWSKKD
jgi:hypothetical protein